MNSKVSTPDQSAASLNFGSVPAGAVLHFGPAAYAVIAAPDGRVASVRVAIRGRAFYCLPGGGALPGEAAEETVLREIREELGRSVSITGKIGEAVQYFHADDEDRWYKMRAGFFHAAFDGEPTAAGEYELCWLDPVKQGELFFHACHAWAAGGKRSSP